MARPAKPQFFLAHAPSPTPSPTAGHHPHHARTSNHPRLGPGVMLGDHSRAGESTESLKRVRTLSSDFDFQGTHGSAPHLRFDASPAESVLLSQAECLDAVMEIHKILYLGQDGTEDRAWDDKVQQVQNLLSECFEGDCVYDTPLSRVSSRSSLLSHFALLHLCSTLYLPSLTPTSLVLHARNATSALMKRAAGIERVDKNAKPSDLAKSDFGLEEVWLGLPEPECPTEGEGWWRLWEVRADCREIGEMECYDGYHLAMVDQIISLQFLPSLVRRMPGSYTSTPLLETPSPIATPNSLPSLPSPSFTSRLATTVLNELEVVLHWELPVTTFVELNEVGKATYIRDKVDLRDAVEAVVPFAKRLGWLTRCFSGMMSSFVGDIILGSAGPASLTGDRAEAAVGMAYKTKEEGFGCVAALNGEAAREGTDNTLGLENVGSAPATAHAPDVDPEAAPFS
ncbi:hypothetical protein L198_05713 [Cryptococcus wingfieldii CBS 7118]|uniref:Uncharacterized protein n=1 Tax=Cryptococcus wingfieldii CBS 7118 TaxID=1295528 RepID=A0A1E3IWG4_9TREE|nr:hypothetical protein L198_05713 [Cryptococcus wingfieldii CBS 7118]ODN92041.1 hypothetical protein L198_05713 [Cryptococcus wingfieldii CBS 7118]